jgi:predicted nucleotidyltransferase component of viral defense system
MDRLSVTIPSDRPDCSKVGESRYQKLRASAKAQGRDPAFAFRLYCFEGMLARLQASRWADAWALKGGMIVLTLPGDGLVRVTSDLDFTCSGDVTMPEVIAIFRELCDSVPAEEDGIVFSLAEGNSRLMREQFEHPTARLAIRATLVNACAGVDAPFVVDVTGAEGPVATRAVTLPKLYKGHVPPTVPGYTWERVLAEKLQTIRRCGAAAGRMRDLWDVCAISRRVDLDLDAVAEEVAAVFALRGTELDDPRGWDGLAPASATAPDRARNWDGLMKRAGADRDAPRDLAATLDEVRDFASRVAARAPAPAM